MKTKLIFAFVMLLMVSISGCVDDGYEVLPLPPVLKNVPITDVIPQEYMTILKEMNFPIYDGTTPPNIEGCYLADDFWIVASNVIQDYPYIGTVATKSTALYRFYGFNTDYNTLGYEYKIKQSELYSSGEGFGNGLGNISGNGNFFTYYCKTWGVTSRPTGESGTGYTANVISGEKTATGIKNLCYALLMLDKDDPYGIIVPITSVRVFQEMDGLASNSTWGALKQPVNIMQNGNSISYNPLIARFPSEAPTNNAEGGK
ncbi:MAG: hypothetical protein LBO69_05800 [Ignavibacteria bacterium]|jgi:hypothetical protein|nr:hypothetical protein [Ignavibacteria bacterium]